MGEFKCARSRACVRARLSWPDPCDAPLHDTPASTSRQPPNTTPRDAFSVFFGAQRGKFDWIESRNTLCRDGGIGCSFFFKLNQKESFT